MASDIGPVTLPSPDHIGVVVKDIDKTVEFLSSVWGIGPWELGEYAPKDAPVKLKLAFGDLGNGLRLELIQPVAGKSLWSDFLEEKGEGIQHIAYMIKNWDELVPKLMDRGGKILVSGAFQGNRFYYWETPGGIIIQLEERK